MLTPITFKEDEGYKQEDDANGISNRVIWGMKGSNGDNFIQAKVCYYNMLGVYSILRKEFTNKPIVFSWFRLNHADITVEQANKFLSDILLPMIPERIIPSLKINPLTNELMADLGRSLDREGETLWLEVEADGRLINMNDLYTIFTLFRFPQESPDSVIKALKHMETYPDMPGDVALLLGLLEHHENYNHSFAGRGSLHVNIRPGCLKQWCFKDIWNKIKVTEPLMITSNKTFQLEKYFIKDLQDPHSNSYPTPKQILDKGWLNV